MKNPERISVAASAVPAGRIEQRTRKVRADEKDDALLEEINARQGSILVFAATQRRTDRLASYLESYGVKVESIHGGRSQGQRNRALACLRDGRARVLVATDVAARGLDVPCVAHVINYDLPMVPEDYVHRIGRTGRAGRSGEAVSLVAPVDRGSWLAIRRILHKASNAEKAARPLVDEIEAEVPGGRGSRPSGRFGGTPSHYGRGRQPHKPGKAGPRGGGAEPTRHGTRHETRQDEARAVGHGSRPSLPPWAKPRAEAAGRARAAARGSRSGASR
jgi:ATP-dependent RNA helicase RhlE